MDFDYSQPHRIVNGAPVLLTPEEIAARQEEQAAGAAQALPNAKAAAGAAIDTKAGMVRLRYITAVPGQADTYIAKAQQAADFKTSGYAGTPPAFVQAEADAISSTPKAAADLILAQRDAWVDKGAQIEKARRAGKIAAAAGIDIAAVLSAQLGAIEALDKL